MNQNAIQRAIRGVMPTVRASGLLVSLATFQAPRGATTEDPAGNMDSAGFPEYEYDDVPGLVDIPCTAPPMSTGDGSVSATESKGLQELMADAPEHVLLDGYYPTVQDGWRRGWRVMIDGIAWDLMGSESDSQYQMTRCFVRRLTQ